MSVWIDKTRNGQDCLRTDSQAVGAGSKVKSLPVDWILQRASDGAFTIMEPVKVPRLSRAQAEMIEHFLAERGMAKPHVFAGQPEREAPKTDAIDEKEVEA